MPETNTGHKYFVGGQTWKEYHEDAKQQAGDRQQEVCERGFRKQVHLYGHLTQGQLRSRFLLS